MTATIVIDDSVNPPAAGSTDNDVSFLSLVHTLSNFDNTGILGWRWTLLDKPAGSSATLSSTSAATTQITPDVEGCYLIRLETYTDAARTLLDGSDEQLIGVRFATPRDWLIPAAGQTTQLGGLRGWAEQVNEILRDARSSLVGFDMQDAYTNDPAIVATAAKSIPWSNAVDATDLLVLSRTFAGGGRALDISMGAGTTGQAARITMRAGGGLFVNADAVGGGAFGVQVSDTVLDDHVQLGTYGLIGLGTNLDFSVGTVDQTTAATAARAAFLTSGAGGPGTVGSAGGAGGEIRIDAGDGGTDGGAGGGAGGAVNIAAGDSVGAVAGANVTIDAGASGAGTDGTIAIGTVASITAILANGATYFAADDTQKQALVQGALTTELSSSVDITNGSSFSAASGVQELISARMVLAQSGTAGYTVLRVSANETGGVGSGNKRLLELETTSVTQMWIDNAGTITPATDNAKDIGTTALNWRRLYVGAGQETNPAINLSGANTGLYLVGGLRVAIGGTGYYQFATGSFAPLSNNNRDLGATALRFQRLYVGSGSTAAPSIAVGIDGTGLSESSNRLDLNVSGSRIMQIRNTGIFSDIDGSAAAPTYSWLSQTDTGLYLSDTTNPTLGVSVEGSAAMVLRRVMDLATTDEVFMDLFATVNKLTSGSWTGLRFNITDTNSPAATNYYMRLQYGSADRFRIEDIGDGQPQLIMGDPTFDVVTINAQGIQFSVGNLAPYEIQSVLGLHLITNDSATAILQLDLQDPTATSGIHDFARIVGDGTGLTSTAGWTLIEGNVSTTGAGSGAKLLLDLQVGGTSQMTVADDGVITVGANGTASAPAVGVGGASQGIYRPAASQLGLAAGTKGIIWDASDFYPDTDNAYSLGKSGARWSDVWATTTTIGDLNLFSLTDGGKWTINEDARGIYVHDRLSGRSYRLMMEEVEDAPEPLPLREAA